ncbi:MAG: cytochrome c3 family protein [Bacteroidota bacterium]|nr:cytochrome c3 family protein [Bacteroidota bacterium]
MRKVILLRHLPIRLKTFISLLLLSILLISGNSLLAQSSDDEEVVLDNHSHEDIQRGERFFKGLLPKDRKFEACVSCHILSRPDTMNWNPSAMDIAVKYAGKDFADFQSAVMEPNGNRMEASHKDFKIEESDLKKVKLYLDELAITGPPIEGPVVNQIVLFLFLILLMVLVILDLIFFHKIKYRFISALILLVSLGYLVKMISEAAINLGRSQNYAPDQPIKFSHKVHAGANKIDCMYCHHTAEFNKSAGIPAMGLCMNCHMIVREGARSGKFEIAKVLEANETQKPVVWVRVHNLPDHVFFSHAQHVGIAKIDCQKCHGQVQEMDILKQSSDLSMGWCINCHRQTKVNFKDNKYYDTYMKLHDDLKSGKIDTIRAVDIGANDCMRCHY